MLEDLAIQTYIEAKLREPRYAEPRRLLRHGYRVYSRHDEDGIIREIFRRVSPFSKTFVEIGLEARPECNTTALLMQGWHGIWLKPEATEGPPAAQVFGDFLGRGWLRHVAEAVRPDNLNRLLHDAGAGGEIDLLSIAAGGSDYWLWESLELVVPRLVVIDYNAALRPPIAVVERYDPERRLDGSNYRGASLEAVVRLGRKKGYCLVSCSLSGLSAFFVRADLCGDRFAEPFTAQNHYEPPRAYLVGSASVRVGFGPWTLLDEAAP